VLDRSVVDKWMKSNDTDSFIMARRLIRQEEKLSSWIDRIRQVNSDQTGQLLQVFSQSNIK
jgi:hypothetical protein